MIEFTGELSEESKRCLLKNNSTLGLVVSLILALIATGIVVTLAIIYSLWSILLLLIVFAMLVVLVTVAPYMQRKKTLDMLLPSKIIIDKDRKNISIYFKNSIVVEKRLSCIKKAIDEGEYYFLKFKFPKIDGFLCQKDLLVEGTIEEFEELFAGKIRRKNKQNK